MTGPIVAVPRRAQEHVELARRFDAKAEQREAAGKPERARRWRFLARLELVAAFDAFAKVRNGSRT